MILEVWQINEYTTRRDEIDQELAMLNTAIAALIANPNASYTIVTGQTTQQVTKQNLSTYTALRDALRAERWGILEALNGTTRSAAFRPDF